ncbi:GFA family protein [Paracoccus sp. MBLB3053]|uniref:GFA family protein n=1 Tax=Paracoccus aurantius TaxID=3073814 RepID=A0ABU2HWK7_9RHOB|nr:GFA family protein [Paracoccus sp. MBLB3053]MDS9469435.1 GFA family protein [Paracoccus sp. MBLB3053]
MQGHCPCGTVRYELAAEPLIVHCCHCTWCQRETGSAFVLNALIETRHVVLECGSVEYDILPSESGQGQKVARCVTCHGILWSHYADSGPRLAFVRVGTLESARLVKPDVHIFALSAHPWVLLSSEVPVFREFYDRAAIWTPEALARRESELRRRD